MTVSRRAFLRRSILLGGSLLLPAGCTREARGSKDASPGGGEAPATKRPSGSEERQDSDSFVPAYARLEAEGGFEERVEQAHAMLESCEICPRRCKVNRLAGQESHCRTKDRASVQSHQPHFGEEVPLVGRHGSGTIFFSSCALRCVFCQNWPIAHEGRGRPASEENIAQRMLSLQRMGCPNINVVTPTHVMPFILKATRLAHQRGLRIPLVWNTSGYELPEVIRLLDGIVDIYLPDVKFMNEENARRYTAGAVGYPRNALASVAEMHRQVGDLVTDENGVALRGLMIRHLVMPNRVAGTRELVRWIAENLSTRTYINIMAQYRVEHMAFNHPKIARAITVEEFLEAMDFAEEAGLTNIDSRAVAQRDVYRRRRRLGR